MKLISGTSNQALAATISEKLSAPLVPTEIETFSNGERRIWIKEKLDNEEVVILQSLSHPTDEKLMELLLLIDAVERLGANEVHVVIPWMGYSLQDKVFRAGEPIAARVVANLISSSYVRRVYLLDLHNSSIAGFFSVPTSHLTAQELFAQRVTSQFPLEQVVVASPDFGGLKRARGFANTLSVPLVNIDKHRDLYTGEVTAVGMHGEVKDKIVILYDDVIMSGGTVVSASDILKEHGAKETHFIATHGVFAGDAVQKITDSSIDSVIITDSIEQHVPSEKISIVPLGGLIAQTLEEWF